MLLATILFAIPYYYGGVTPSISNSGVNTPVSSTPVSAGNVDSPSIPAGNNAPSMSPYSGDAQVNTDGTTNKGQAISTSGGSSSGPMTSVSGGGSAQASTDGMTSTNGGAAIASNGGVNTASSGQGALASANAGDTSSIINSINSQLQGITVGSPGTSTGNTTSPYK